MINVGSQATLCDLPIRMDTYGGCTHGCSYCFTKRKVDIQEIKAGDHTASLTNFIRGKRTKLTESFDFNIPLHWGGLSDPFQPIENKYSFSYKYLKILASSGYPFVVSTKGLLIGTDKYLEVLKDCNAVVQISMLSPKFDKYENITYQSRLDMLRKIADNSKRLIIRVQPYVPEIKDDLIAIAETYKEAGVYGITIEGMKLNKKAQGLTKFHGDFVIPLRTIRTHFVEIKKIFNNLGMKVYGAKNRLRSLGDSLSCCGVEGVEGFDNVNKYNLNHLLFDKVKPEATEMQKMKGTAYLFKASHQSSVADSWLRSISFKDYIDIVVKKKPDLVG